MNAREANDYKLFEDALTSRIEAERERASAFEIEDEGVTGIYDRLLDEYETEVLNDSKDYVSRLGLEKSKEILFRIVKR